MALTDQAWLLINQPDLRLKLLRVPYMGVGDKLFLAGGLRVSGYYDADSNRFVSGSRAMYGGHSLFVSDQFTVAISYHHRDEHGWRRVIDLDGRHRSIAKRYGVPVSDLHFYPQGYACLGLPYPWDPSFGLKDFIAELVEPFFYRLAYVDLYGLDAARSDLWGEYSHYELGFKEHQRYVRASLRQRRQRKSISSS